MIPAFAPKYTHNANRMPRKVAQSLSSGESSADHTYDALREAIVSLGMPPGERLVRKDLSRQLGISLTPLRDALLRLEAIGLVETRPQAETRVSLIDRQALFELQFQRIALETEVVRRLAQRGAARASAGSPIFHEALFRSVGMETVYLGFMERYAPFQRCRNVVPGSDDDRRQRTDFQSQILGRVAARDAAGAVAAMRALLSGKGGVIGQAQRQRPDWFR